MTNIRETNGDRREQILEAATSLFADRGYTLTSLMDIAHRLGITAPAIYHWFTSKDDILFQIVERNVTNALDETTHILEEHPDPVEALARLAEAHVARVLENVERNTVYRRDRVHLEPKDADAIVTLEARYEALYHDVYAKGVAAGRLVAVDPRIGIGVFLEGCRWAFRGLGNIPNEELGPATVSLVMRSIVADPADPVLEKLSIL